MKRSTTVLQPLGYCSSVRHGVAHRTSLQTKTSPSYKLLHNPQIILTDPSLPGKG